MSVFAQFSPRLQQAIVARLGWSSLRPVQEHAGEALLAGMNAVVLAPTAGGKTEAAMFPTLSGMVDDGPEAVGAIYVAPIKALLNNQADRLGLYTEMVGLRRFVWHGDTGDNERRQFLREPTELLMTTPESLEVMLVSRRVEAPDTVGAFLQRMGRTGRRAGQATNTTFFCKTEEGILQATALIELAKSGWVEDVEVNDRCWPVLIHQLLAMSLASDGITVEEAWAHLSVVPDFCGITRDEFDRLIAWMLEDGSLILASGQLVLGPKAERRFGRRNFMELFAVFSSPQALASIGGNWQITPDNYQIAICGDQLDEHAFLAAIKHLAEHDLWDNEDFWHQVADSLPSYRLGKFQPLMPSWIERVVVATYLLDIPGAWRWLSAMCDQRKTTSD